jgi:hypothetical protein
MRNAIHSEAVVLVAERSQLPVQRLPPFALATHPEPKMEELEPPGARSVSDLGQFTLEWKDAICAENSRRTLGVSGPQRSPSSVPLAAVTGHLPPDP